CQLNGKDQVANYAIRTESSNRDPTYIKKAETICRTYGWLALGGFIACVFIGLIVWFPVYITTRDPYSPVRDPPYKIHMKTGQYGIDFYVKSGFDKKYPVGTPARAELERRVINEYIENKQRYCHQELSHRWYYGDKNYPIDDCD
ncbi:chaperone protein DnaJ 49, partial [Tanacetum coccineum]